MTKNTIIAIILVGFILIIGVGLYLIDEVFYDPLSPPPIMTTVIWNGIPVTYDCTCFGEEVVKQRFTESVTKYGDEIASVMLKRSDRSRNEYKITIKLKNGEIFGRQLVRSGITDDYNGWKKESNQ